jgi:hypothetical protein
VAVGLLLPVSGAVILLAGETILVLRLFLSGAGEHLCSAASFPQCRGFLGCSVSGRSVEWGLTATMALFARTLQDRIAEYGAAFSFLLWLMLNAPARVRPHAG